ncbi:SDR family NAD(P)-dependent oxidoreductase [Candidatus Hydrogenedentota bacterium]
MLNPTEDVTMELSGEVALVTGASRGIGRGIALAFGKAGAKVAVNYASNEAAAQEVIELIGECGGEAIAVKASVESVEEVAAMMARVREELGGPAIVVNNGGGGCPGKLEDLSEEDWEKALSVHLRGPARICKDVIPTMREAGGGCIINMCSVAAIRGLASGVAYGTVKGALLQFTRCLAFELGEDNIRVNAISPGVIHTDFHKNMTPEGRDITINTRQPLHVKGMAEHIAEAALFLVRDDFITGENIVIDGGLTSRIA